MALGVLGDVEAFRQALVAQDVARVRAVRVHPMCSCLLPPPNPAVLCCAVSCCAVLCCAVLVHAMLCAIVTPVPRRRCTGSPSAPPPPLPPSHRPSRTPAEVRAAQAAAPLMPAPWPSPPLWPAACGS